MCPSVSAIDGGNSSDNIFLKGNLFETSKLVPNQEKAIGVYSYDNHESYYIVQFKGPIHPEWNNKIKKVSKIYDYVPDNSYILSLDDKKAERIMKLPYFKWMGKIKPEYKVESSLHGLNKETIVTVSIFDSNGIPHLKKSLIKMDADIIEENIKHIRVKVNGSMVSSVAKFKNVSWIEKYHQPSILNDKATDIVEADKIYQSYDLGGSGQVVAVADTGLDTGNTNTLHKDFQGRVNALYDRYDGNPADQNGHGTHVAGSVLGNGSLSEGKYKGMAPEANLFFQACGDGSNKLEIPSLNRLLSEAYDNGSRIHSNSWGENTFSSYTTEAIEIDNFTWHHSDMLVLFAAGNDGPYSRTIISPGNAKNALTVGASETYRPEKGVLADDVSDIARFSSRGPTEDARIKPDVVAPGTYILSTASSLAYEEDYVYMSGTSMSTPVTAGSAAIVRQYLTDDLSIQPSAALLKAVLINGAVDLGHSNMDQGWGRINLNNSIYSRTPKNIRYHDDVNLTTGSNWTIKYYVDNSQSPLKTTLVWTDYPPSDISGKALVNNLDLNIISPNKSKYYGNGAPDDTNNVEQILIDSPETGWYTFTVNGKNVPMGNEQPFSIVISGGSLNNETVVNRAIAQPRVLGLDDNYFTTLKVELNEKLIDPVVYVNLSKLGGYQRQPMVNNSSVWEYNLNTTKKGTYYLGVNVTYNETLYDDSTFIELEIVDKKPPSSITDLYVSNYGYNWINWTWTNPLDNDFNHSVIFFNGSKKNNTSNAFYNATGLLPNTSYQIGIKTVDTSGNINQTMINNTNTTLPDTIPPKIHGIYLENETPYEGDNVGITVNVTDNCYIKSVIINGANLTKSNNTYWTGTFKANAGQRYLNISAKDVSGNIAWNNTTNYTGLVKPNANFISNVTAGRVPLTVQFIDKSENATGWRWDVNGNGSVEYKSQNPIHTYNKAGIYNVNLSVSNDNGSDFLFINDFITVTVPVVEKSNKITSSGSNGGSSGTGEPFDNVDFKDVKKEYINKNSEIEYKFDNKANPVKVVRFTPLINAGYVNVVIEILKDTSGLVTKEPVGKLYRNVNIWVGKGGWGNNDTISKPIIIFNVNKTWINENNVTKKSIKLFRYSLENKSWNKLETVLINENESVIRYKSYVPGFSPFAIISTEKLRTENSEELIFLEPKAGFNAKPTTGTVPLTVNFTESSENVDKFHWVFGDGENSNQKNPVHIYEKAGKYIVNLTVTNGEYNDTATTSITVVPKPDVNTEDGLEIPGFEAMFSVFVLIAIVHILRRI
jgi:PGF-pre-PGF domain-containing protein